VATLCVPVPCIFPDNGAPLIQHRCTSYWCVADGKTSQHAKGVESILQSDLGRTFAFETDLLTGTILVITKLFLQSGENHQRTGRTLSGGTL
jgi:hypothetical protein